MFTWTAKFLGPTNSSPARIKVYRGASCSVHSWDHALDTVDNYRKAIRLSAEQAGVKLCSVIITALPDQCNHHYAATIKRDEEDGA